MPDRNCDYLVIGGGAAGCVIAARLSEDPALTVRLIEAGPVYPPDEEPPAIADIVARSSMNPAFTWHGVTTIPIPDPDHPEGGVKFPYVHGRVLGGGSAVNGMNAHRGLPRDYDEWAEYGVTGWSWTDVLPFFRKLENDEDFSDDLHGNSGPVPITRWPREAWSPFELAIDRDWERRQLPFVEDLNGAQATGRFPVSLSAGKEHRVSAARAYLTARVRDRPNLEILGNAEAEALIVEDGRATGVQARRAGQLQTFHARHVVLSCGSLASPTLLMRAGIGDGGALARAGIEPLVHRPGVGANLQNHPSMMLTGYLFGSNRVTGRRPMTASCSRYSSGVADCPDADMMNVTLGMAPDATVGNPLGRCLGSILAVVNKVCSRGAVLPTRAGLPHVVGNMFGDERDLLRLADALIVMRQQFDAMREARLVDQVFFATSGGIQTDSGMTRILNRIAVTLLDSNRWLRGKILERAGIPVETIPVGGNELIEWVRKHGLPGYHVSGTCRMGRENDPLAVVDSRCRVIGIQGISVVDTSIFPTLMRAGTCIPAMMAAERIADLIKADRRHCS